MSWIEQVVRAGLAGGAVYLCGVGACETVRSIAPERVARAEQAEVRALAKSPVRTEAIALAPLGSAESGTRLSARWYQGADGARQFAGFYDAELGQSCEFALAIDGVPRCLPKVASGSPFFLDSACTERVIWDSVCTIPEGSPVAFTLATRGEECGLHAALRYDTRYFSAGPEVKPRAVWQSGPHGCKPSTVFESGVYRRLETEIPVTRFVAAQVSGP